VPERLERNKYIRPGFDPLISQPIEAVVKILEAHSGLFIVDGIEYDNILYCGNDNLYFSYCFNFKTGRALSETLLIVDDIKGLIGNAFVVISQGKEYSIVLKD